MARPKVLADNEVRNSVVTIRVTEEVYLDLQRRASREETSISTLMYEVAKMYIGDKKDS